MKKDLSKKHQPISWVGSTLFLSVHVLCILVLWAGVSWVAVLTAIFLYWVRMFGITAGYHRYFSHRTYKTSRVFQFLLAFLGASAAQMGPLWWASHHRKHHQTSDHEEDIHSPVIRDLWWAHMGWLLRDEVFTSADYKNVKDLSKYPELRLLDRFSFLAPILLGLLLFCFGSYLAIYAPQFHTNGFQMLVWGFFISTTVLYHGTFLVNSICHVFGSVRFNTGDHSKNNFWVALLTMGEGWHNNHHQYPGSERQGIYWWEIDFSHYILKFFEKLGLVWSLGTPGKASKPTFVVSTFVVIAAFLFFNPLGMEKARALDSFPCSSWQKVNKGKIVVEDIANSYLGGKGCMLVSAQPKILWEVITDYNQHDQYVSGISQSKAKKIKEDQFLLYAEYKTPWPFDPIFMEGVVTHEKEKPKGLKMTWKAERTNLKDSFGGWKVIPYQSQTLVIHEMNFDISFIPDFLANSLSHQAIKFVMESIRERALELEKKGKGKSV